MDRGTFEGTLDRQTEDWSTENRSLAKADSTEYGIGKSASALEDETTYNRVYIKPAAKKIGLTKRIGWHTFRHTFGTILNANGENPKGIQELRRHANLKVTMDTYVQAVSDEKRKAKSKVVEMIMPGIRKAAR